MYIYASAKFQTRLKSPPVPTAKKNIEMAPKNSLKRENNVFNEYETKLPGQLQPKKRIRIML